MLKFQKNKGITLIALIVTIIVLLILARSNYIWVIIDVNSSTGEVKIMPKAVSDKTLNLSGKDGYNNAIDALDVVAGIYLNPDYATSAKSITVEDINKVEGYTPNGEVSTQTWNHRYGMNPTTLDITDAGEGNTPSQTYTSTATTGSYNYLTKCFSGMPNFWLASRCVSLMNTQCSFYVRFVYDGNVTVRANIHSMPLFYPYNRGQAYNFNGSADGGFRGYCVLPVVTLKSDVQLETNGTYTEVATGTSTATATGAYAEKLGVHNVWTIK